MSVLRLHTTCQHMGHGGDRQAQEQSDDEAANTRPRDNNGRHAPTISPNRK